VQLCGFFLGTVIAYQWFSFCRAVVDSTFSTSWLNISSSGFDSAAHNLNDVATLAIPAKPARALFVV
jgi:hypothetical protein